MRSITLTLVVALTLLLSLAPAMAQTDQQSPPGLSQQDQQDGNQPRRRGPPPEAFTACEGKTAGATAEFVSPRGDTISGTCELADGRMVLRPTRPAGEGGRRQQRPNQ